MQQLHLGGEASPYMGEMEMRWQHWNGHFILWEISACFNDIRGISIHGLSCFKHTLMPLRSISEYPPLLFGYSELYMAIMSAILSAVYRFFLTTCLERTCWWRTFFVTQRGNASRNWSWSQTIWQGNCRFAITCNLAVFFRLPNLGNFQIRCLEPLFVGVGTNKHWNRCTLQGLAGARQRSWPALLPAWQQNIFRWLSVAASRYGCQMEWSAPWMLHLGFMNVWRGLPTRILNRERKGGNQVETR